MTRSGVEDVYRLAPLQEGMLLAGHLAPGSGAYVVQIACTLTGALDVAALRGAWAGVVERHTALRTSFHWQGLEVPHQVVHARVELPFRVEDWRGVPAAARAGRLAAWMDEDRRRGFEPAQPPLLRLALLRLAADAWRFVFTHHHLILDGWSQPLLFREVFTLYEARRAGAPAALPPPVPYRTYVEWLRRQDRERAQDFWRRELAGWTGPTPLPGALPPGARPGAVRWRGSELSAAHTAALRALAQRHGLTLNTVVQGAWGLLLARAAGEDEVVFGAVVAGRPPAVPGVERMLGLCINSLPLRLAVPRRQDLLPWLAAAQRRQLALREHEWSPLTAVREWSGAPAGRPLFESVLVFENYPLDEALGAGVPGVAIGDFTSRQGNLEALTVVASPGERLRLDLGAQRERFPATAAGRLLAELRTVLEGMAEDPERPLGELPLLPAAERHQVLIEWAGGGPAAPPPAGTLDGRFAAQAARRPEAVAVSGPAGEAMTYGELAARVGALAARLRACGVGPGARVALLLDRGPGLVAGVVGALAAGAAYVPLDPAFPDERLGWTVEDAGAALLVTEAALAGRAAAVAAGAPGAPELPVVELDRCGETPPRSAAGGVPRGTDGAGWEGGRPAYVIYTSGSTGRPKGVVVTHGNVLRLFDATAGWFDFGPGDAWTLFHSAAFDFSVWELWGALLHGGRLVIVPQRTARSPEEFLALLAREQVTVVNQTPSAFRQLVAAEARPGAGKALDLSQLRLVCLGGEALEPAALAPWIARHGDRRPRLVNMYGITETTVHVTYRPLGAGDLDAGSVLGRPIPDLSLRLQDRDLQPPPIGAVGEIVVGGAGVALGYLGRPGLTAERFLPDLFGPPGARIYRSGDLARRLPDGDLEFAGRADEQVKIRGYRVEPAETAAALARDPRVREVAVVARDDGPPSAGPAAEGRLRLVAYVVPAGEPPTLAALRAALAATLPDHLLPEALVVLPALPLTANGKLDRRALPPPDAGAAAAPAPPPDPPRTPLETLLAALVGEVLRVPPPGREESFFDLGGNSLSAVVLTHRLQERLKEIVHVVTVFDHPTVARLADHLAGQHAAAVERLLGGAAHHAPTTVAGAAPAPRVDEAALARLRAIVEDGRAARGVPRPPRRRLAPAVFVLSPPRSGSTLLRVMLAGHPRLFAPPELELLGFATLAERAHAFSGRDAFWREGLLRALMELSGAGVEEARAEAAAWEEAATPAPEVYRRLQDRLGGRLLVDKTPSYALDPAVLARAEEWFERPLYLHLLRHPAAAVRSFVEAKLDQLVFRAPHPFTRRELAELVWTASHRNVSDFLAGVPAARRLRVRFEELVVEPERVLREVAAFLGVPYDAAMVDPYAGGSARMTDGPHAESRMLGDVKFRAHGRIDPAAAQRWRDLPHEEPLGEPARELAASLGYGVESVPAADAVTPGGWRPGEPLPLSFAQERLWFLHRMDPASAAYTIFAAVRLDGRLQAAVLQAALAAVVRRHAALRTRFAVAGGRPVQVVLDEVPLPLPLVDLAALPATAGETERTRLTAEAAGLRFDLATCPLLRATLLREAEGRHALLLALHHVVADGWSMGVLVREVAALYAACAIGRGLPASPASPLPPLPLQVPDFALWQRRRLTPEAIAADVAWWRARLEGAPPLLDLPLDRPRPPVHGFRGGHVATLVPSPLAAACAQLARGQEATLFMALLALWAGLLSRHTGERDLVVGAPTANRDRAETRDLIGCFVNTLALRLDLAAEGGQAPGMAALVRRARAAALAAYAHAEVPFERLVEELTARREGVSSHRRDLRHQPLFQVMLALQETPPAPPPLPGLALSPLPADNPTAKFDLTLVAAPGPGGLALTLGYNRDLLHPTTVRRLLRHLEALLAAAVAEPQRPFDELSLLAPAERQQLLHEWNDTAARAPQPARPSDFATAPTVAAGAPDDASLDELVAAWAAQQPDAVAVSDHGEALTYGELARRAAALAARLVELSVVAEAPVAVCLPRGAPLAVALLAALAAGGVYVPLDPAHPRDRRRALLGACGARVLVTDGEGAAELTGASAGAPRVVVLEIARNGRDAPAPRQSQEPDRLAYLIYTSGSTGTPNGVLVSHRSAVNLVREAVRFYGVTLADRVLQVASPGFDASLLEVFLALASGATLVPVSDRERRDPALLAERIRREEVTAAVLTPSLLALLPETALPALRVVSAGGEALPAELAVRWAPGRRFLNCYGPTEATVFATAACPADGREPAIGRPIAGVRAHVVDEALGPVPLGVAGELVLGGAGVARGYLGNPARTAERFVPDPFSDRPGERLYRTGDRARRLPAGELAFLGRLDGQVKVRGHRVEPAEVEAVLASHPEVRAAAVVAARGRGGEPQLVAYVEPAGTPGEDDLRRFLAERLPEFMLPARCVALPELPRTPSGKLDRRALPDPDLAPRAGTAAAVPPRDAAERLVAGLFGDVLGVAPDRVGAGDDFFALGGNSVAAAVATDRLQRLLGETVHVVALFEAPTVEGLARWLARHYPAALARATGEAPPAAPAAAPSAPPMDEAEVARFRALVPVRPPRPPRRWAPAPANPRAVFILSPPRSGSTLLRVLLAGHPGLFAPPELELLGFDTLRERRETLSGRFALWREGTVRALMALHGCGMEQAERRMAAAEAEDLPVQEFYRRLQERLGGRLLVEKTASYALDPVTLARAEEEFDRPLYVHLLRHPAAVVRSFERAHLEQVFFRPLHDLSPRRLAELIWIVSHRNVVEFLARLPAERWCRVRFEELVAEPRAVMERLGRFLGVGFHPGMLRPYDDPAARMTDGAHALSRMVGDVRFHEHRTIDRAAADAWRGERGAGALGEPTRELARALGYEEPEEPAAAAVAASPAPLIPLGDWSERSAAREPSPLERAARRHLRRPGPAVPAPLLLVHPIGGAVHCYRDLARALGPAQLVYGAQAAGLLDGAAPRTSVEAMAAAYVERLRRLRPQGPYALGGWSAGGVVAFEMARRLTEAGEEVAPLALLDALAPGRRPAVVPEDEAHLLAALAHDLAGQAGGNLHLPAREAAADLDLDAALDRLAALAVAAGVLPAAAAGREQARALWEVFRAHAGAVRSYRPRPYPGRAVLVRAARRHPGADPSPDLGWGPLVTGGLEVREVDADHHSLLRAPAVGRVAEVLLELARAEKSSAPAVGGEHRRA